MTGHSKGHLFKSHREFVHLFWIFSPDDVYLKGSPLEVCVIHRVLISVFDLEVAAMWKAINQIQIPVHLLKKWFVLSRGFWYWQWTMAVWHIFLPFRTVKIWFNQVARQSNWMGFSLSKTIHLLFYSVTIWSYGARERTAVEHLPCT